MAWWPGRLHTRTLLVAIAASLVAAFVLAGLLAAPSEPASAAFSGGNGKIVLSGAPKPTPTPNGIDFSIRVRAPGGGVLCDSSGSPASGCAFDKGAPFDVDVYLHALPVNLPSEGYRGYEAALEYKGVSFAGGKPEQSWPGCFYEVSAANPGWVIAGCVLHQTSPGSTYTGLMETFSFTCDQSGTITLQHDAGPTDIVDSDSVMYKESGSESLEIDCSAAPTPPPPTPKPSALDFSIGVQAGADVAADCSSAGSPGKVCQVRRGASFEVRFRLQTLPSDLKNGLYTGDDGVLEYSGVTTAGTADAVTFSLWPQCQKPATYFPPAFAYFGCAVGIGDPGSAYTGDLASVRFTCEGDGTITLLHGSGYSDLVDSNASAFHDPDGSEWLDIQCLEPQAYPGDVDTDRCPDAKEEGTNAAAGGMRNFLNKWDYFNPTGDGLNRIDDVLAVLEQYFIDGGDAGYTPDTDRTLLGPNPWNLGPPNGQQRVDDILYVINQYFHDCN